MLFDFFKELLKVHLLNKSVRLVHYKLRHFITKF